MSRIVLALGSNLGNCQENLRKAIELIQEKFQVNKHSSVICTKPMYVQNQPDFYNMVLLGETHLQPHELLIFLKLIEKKLGRYKTFQNGPRVIDIDIIAYDTKLIDDPVLQIPHPLYTERLFVLEPLFEVCPHWVCPRSGKSILRLLGDFGTIDNNPSLFYKRA
jgi:2-amino-4-hydroxy-6-hydroxymethyldihydropteridine diphosphokinase